VIELDVEIKFKDKPERGYRTLVRPEYELFGYWLDGDVRDGEDDYDIEMLWRNIGRYRRDERMPQLEVNSDACIVQVSGEQVLILSLVYGNRSLQLPLLAFADATERWFDVVNPHIAAKLRGIRASWA
jgi:hypothetical protein